MDIPRKRTTLQLIISILYILGCLCVLILTTMIVFGGTGVTDLDAMLPYNSKEQGFLLLGIGFIPMILVCLALYRYGGLQSLKGHLFKRLLIFLPTILCGVCAITIIVILIMGMINSFFLQPIYCLT